MTARLVRYRRRRSPREERGFDPFIGATNNPYEGPRQGMPVDKPRPVFHVGVGVTPAQSQASGYRIYTFQAGVRKFESSVGAEYSFVNDWKLRATLVLTRLSGDAQDSLLVVRKSNASASLAIAYMF